MSSGRSTRRRGRTGPHAHPVRRVRAMFIASMFVLSIFAAQLVRIQGFDADKVAATALAQRLYDKPIPALRGQITDASGTVLAQSVERYTIVADQLSVQKYTKKANGKNTQVGARGAADDLAPLLGLNADDLFLKLNGSKRYWKVAVDVTPVVWRSVSKLAVPGISVERTTKRVYPSGPFDASLVGVMNNADVPVAGVELMADEALRGTPGSERYETSATGRQIPTGNSDYVAPVPGRDVRLTIDSDLQLYAQNELAKAVTERNALSGTAVVMDVKTAQLLAVANYPTFDPNNLANAPTGSTLANKAFQEAFEPGSTAKVLSLSAALQEGLITPSTPITVPSELKKLDKTFKDSEEHGVEELTATGVLAKSSNMGTIIASDGLRQNAKILRYFTDFGLGRTSGIGFPAESAGQIPKTLHDTNQYTIMFGQGLSVNAVQAASVYQTIADGGVRVAPSLVAGEAAADGTYTPVKAPAQQQVLRGDVAHEMSEMLESVTGDDGTASKVRVPGYRIAGKTGTADRYVDKRAVDGKPGYEGYTASFIGYAPAGNPRFVIAVMLQRPLNGHYGGLTAGPVFTSVMRYALGKYGVPPDTAPAPNFPVWQPGYSADHPNGAPLPALMGPSAARNTTTSAGTGAAATKSPSPTPSTDATRR